MIFGYFSSLFATYISKYAALFVENDMVLTFIIV